jgi:Nup93/Nic96.
MCSQNQKSAQNNHPKADERRRPRLNTVKGEEKEEMSKIIISPPGMNEMYRVLLDLKENGGSRVSSKMERAMKNQYKPYVRNSSDPYKRLVYSALGE